MKEVQEARRIKMLHQPSKVLTYIMFKSLVNILREFYLLAYANPHVATHDQICVLHLHFCPLLVKKWGNL